MLENTHLEKPNANVTTATSGAILERAQVVYQWNQELYESNAWPAYMSADLIRCVHNYTPRHFISDKNKPVDEHARENEAKQRSILL